MNSPSLQLNKVTIKASQHVRVLGVNLHSDLSLGKHHLRQLKCIKCSFDTESAATLVHAFVTSRVNYCNAVLAAAPNTTNHRQATTSVERCYQSRQRHPEVWPRTVATDAPGTRLGGHPRASQLQLLADPPCLLGKAPVYLSNCCNPVAQVATCQHIRSAARHQLTRHRLSTYGPRAFAVARSDDIQRSVRSSARSLSRHSNLRTIVEGTSVHWPWVRLL